MTRLHQLSDYGQAIWLDFIRRAHLADGSLQALIDQGVRGVTSNPTIFEQAIGGSDDYDSALRRLTAAGATPAQIYEDLVLEDIATAADQLRPLYAATSGQDGYVSLEVSPQLAHDTTGTVAAGLRLFLALARPNVMIKVPATPAGLPAISDLIAAGVNVNVTLIFALAQYEAVAQAYLAGLERRATAGADLRPVASVASFFISRVDAAVDPQLERAGAPELIGRTAIANAKLAYARFRELFAGLRWERLAAAGARVQRPLWASTGTKDARLPATHYVDGLVGPGTVNTVPPATLTAFLAQGQVAPTLAEDVLGAQAHLAKVAALGVDLERSEARNAA
jgi:transaldolase